MSTQDLYNQWVATYDVVENKTRDLEQKAAQENMVALKVNSALELGCGTGKNTAWLSEKAKRICCVDFSEGMLEKAKEKIRKDNVHFIQADITKPWEFVAEPVDLITCSLILEHIQDLAFIFQQANKALQKNGYFYICELHPYKQYAGSKARFETEEGLAVLECFVHNISAYVQPAFQNGFGLIDLQEWFDEDQENQPPRLVSFLFQKR